MIHSPQHLVCDGRGAGFSRRGSRSSSRCRCWTQSWTWSRWPRAGPTFDVFTTFDLEARVHATSTQATTPSLALGVHSEVGRLRKVLVCAPGLAHRRLTPTNSDELLFDDVMW